MDSDSDEEELEGTMTLEEISWYIDSLSNYHKIFLHRMLAMVRSFFLAHFDRLDDGMMKK
jgi:hypothetical protein